MKTQKPRLLNLSDIWKLYRLLQPSWGNKLEDTVEATVDKMFRNLPEGSVYASCLLMYDKIPEGIDPTSLFLMFTEGLVLNNFMRFVVLVKELSNG